MTFIVYFLLQALVKLRRRVSGHFVMLYIMLAPRHEKL